jgi:signal transduction histidine kinase
MAKIAPIVPRDDPAQALRVRRFLVGSFTYLLVFSQAILCWWFSYLDGKILASVGLLMFLVNIGFYSALRSGFNQRFADPSLTLAQLVVGVASGILLMYFTGQARIVFILMTLPVFLYGIFQFRQREFYVLTGFTLTGYGILIILLWRNRPGEINLQLAIMIGVAILIMLLQMSQLAGFITHMRWKITEKNRELGKRNIDLLERSDELQQAHAEVAQALATLRLANEELVRKEKLAALGALVAGVAHEINTPVGNSLMAVSMLEKETMRLHSEYANEQGVKRATMENYLDDAHTACLILQRNLQRAADLITRFKQVAIDQTSSQRRHFTLAELVPEIELTLVSQNRDEVVGAQFEIEQAPNAPPGFDSYPGPLGQALCHVIGNAQLHAFEDGRPGSIRVHASASADGWVDIKVSDNGVGIAPEHLPRIFDPFFTTKFGTGGSGLGLNITHNIVTGILGGQIRVTSTPGQGTEVTISIPCTAPESPRGIPLP